jgi:hypothetical protein
VGHHVAVEFLDYLATGFNAQKGKYGMNQAGQGARCELERKSECMTHMLEVAFVDVFKMVCEVVHVNLLS